MAAMPPLFLSAFLLLAQATPPPTGSDPGSAQSIGWLLLCLFAIAGGANQVMGVVAKFREAREPQSGEVSADRMKALEKRVSDMDARFERRLDEALTRLDTITKTFGQVVADFNYAIGKIDGREER
jgi:glutathione S-transferase